MHPRRELYLLVHQGKVSCMMMLLSMVVYEVSLVP